MIVRNAEETLPHCISSVNGHVDAIVALMVGESSDHTEDVLRQTGCIYAKREWHDDFSRARNELFDYARSVGVRWALLLDADDILGNAPGLREAVAKLEADDIGEGFLHIAFGRLSYWQKRIFDLTKPGKWVARVHEVYVSQNKTTKVPGIDVVHIRGTLQATRNKDRNLRIFEKWYAEAPHEFDAHTFYNYGNELAWHGRHEDAARVYGLALGLPQWVEERYYTHIRRGECFVAMKAYTQAWEEFCAAAKLFPEWDAAYKAMARWFYTRGLGDICLIVNDYAQTKVAPQTILPSPITDEWHNAVMEAARRDAERQHPHH